MKNSLLRTLVVMVLAVAGAQAAARQPEEAPDFSARLEAAQRQLEADFAAGVEALDRLAEDSVALRGQRNLTDDERPLHRELFLARARAHLQLLDNPAVEHSFRELLRVDPFYAGTLSPLEREIMDGLFGREGGFIELSGLEPDSQLFVDDIDAGVSGPTPSRFALLEGEYEIRIEKDGFEPIRTVATVLAGQVVTLRQVGQQRRLPAVLLLADRAGVQVWVDGQAAGETVGVGTLRAALAPEEAASLGRIVADPGLTLGQPAGFVFRPTDLSGPVELRLTRDCFLDATLTLDVSPGVLADLDPSERLYWPGDAAMVRMEPDEGTLRVTSTPVSADVFLDGERIGVTPFEGQVCAGQHTVRVRHTIGSHTSVVVVPRGRTHVLEAVIKPGLAFLGAVEQTAAGYAPAPDLTATLDRALATSMAAFALASREETPEGRAWTDASAADLVSAHARGSAADMTNLLRSAREAYAAPLLVSAVRRPPPAEPSVHLLVFWAEHGLVDVLPLPAAPAEFETMLAGLAGPEDTDVLIYQNDLGLRVVDDDQPGGGLLVVRVVPDSLAAGAGVEPGHRIATVDGSAVSARLFRDLVAGKRVGDVVALQVAASPGDVRDVPVTVQRRPRAVSAFDPLLSANMLLARLTAEREVASAPAERDLLRFNLGLVHMRMGQWQEAFELLGGLETLPVGPGVGPSVALYLRARCLEALGERNQAIEFYGRVSQADGESLFDDGSSVGAAARRRLAAMSAGTTVSALDGR